MRLGRLAIPERDLLELVSFGEPLGVAREYRRLVEEYSHLPISSTKFPILTA